MLTINVIGCGRVGKTLAKLIKEKNLGLIGGLLNSTYESTQAAVKFVGEGKSCKTISELPTADIYLIATRDDLIEQTCSNLVKETTLKKGAIVIHCSGSLSSDILKDAQQVGCYTLSIHPIKSFANPETSVATFLGTYCAYEGDEKALAVIGPLFQSMGAVLFSIKKELKTLYHAAGVIANNYLVGLHHTAYQCYLSAGVDEKTSYKVASMLMNDALKNLQTSNHKQSLTGPLARGDTGVINKHLSSLDHMLLVKDVYKILGKATLPITNHSNEIKNDLENSLDESQNNQHRIVSRL